MIRRGLPARFLLPALVPFLLTRCTPPPPEPSLAEQALAIAALFETLHPYNERTVDSLARL
ncbi:MAG: hypothetical protein Q8N53_14755 [Longimicrobiales bacterium]|nr:hypothetical protein [Longimicrobiales bacterium]